MAQRKKQMKAAPSVPASPTVANINTKAWLAVIVALHLILAGVYNAITPPGDHNPDEGAHVLYVQTLAHGHVPVLRTWRLASEGYEAHQPPLYYLLCVPVYLATQHQGGDVITHALRWVSTLIGALFVLAAFGCVRTLFPNDPLLALGAAAFAALLPMNVSQSASVTNDSLTNLVMVAGLWLLARVVMTTGQTGERRMWMRHAAWLGLILGIGVWTKTLTLPLFPCVLVVYALLARSGRPSLKSALSAGGIALGLGLLLGAPWFLRNQFLYGDPLAQHAFTSVLSGPGFNTKAEAFAHYYWLQGYGDYGSWGAYLIMDAQWTFASFWGGFDSMRAFWGVNHHAPGPNFFRGPGALYGILGVISVIALVGLVRELRARRRSPQAILFWGFATLLATIAISFLLFNLDYFQAQGRYYFPALVPLALFFVLGLRGLFPRPVLFRAAVFVMGVGLLALNLYTIFGLLLPRYAGT